MYYDARNGTFHDVSLIEVRPLEDYKVWCRLSTGDEYIYDFTPHLEWPMFQHLKNKTKFDDVGVSEAECLVERK